MRTEVQEFHASAFLNCKKTLINRHLDFEILKNQKETKSSKKKFELSKVYVNAPSAPYGDFILTLETMQSGRKTKFNEVGQCTLYQQSTYINQDMFDKERKKSAVSGKDLFIFYTSKRIQPGKIKLRNMEGYVDGNNWNNYFGPFAGRLLQFYGGGR